MLRFFVSSSGEVSQALVQCFRFSCIPDPKFNAFLNIQTPNPAYSSPGSDVYVIRVKVIWFANRMAMIHENKHACFVLHANVHFSVRLRYQTNCHWTYEYHWYISTYTIVNLHYHSLSCPLFLWGG